MMSLVVLAKLTDISNGQAKGFDPLNNGQDSMFVVRQDDKDFQLAGLYSMPFYMV